MTLKKKINGIILRTCCFFAAATMLYPLLWLISSSLKESSEVFSDAASLIPHAWKFSNYVEGWRGFGGISFGTFYKNTVFLVVIETIGVVFSSAVVAYGFSRIKFKGSNFWFVVMLVTMMLPQQVLQIPQFVLFNKLGWVNTYLPLIVPAFFGKVFDIFLIMQFIRGIPYELDEAAKLDGCNKYKTFFYVVLPLIKPALTTVAIFTFYAKWDDFMGPLIYINKPSMYPISLALRSFSDPSAVTNWGAMFAMSTLSLIPVFIVFFIAQNQISDGISTTGLKG